MNPPEVLFTVMRNYHWISFLWTANLESYQCPDICDALHIFGIFHMGLIFILSSMQQIQTSKGVNYSDRIGSGLVDLLSNGIRPKENSLDHWFHDSLTS